MFGGHHSANSSEANSSAIESWRDKDACAPLGTYSGLGGRESRGGGCEFLPRRAQAGCCPRYSHGHSLQKETCKDIENKLMVTKRERGWGRETNQEFGISRSNYYRKKQTHSKVLLHSTGNYIQYLVINYNGKDYEKE